MQIHRFFEMLAVLLISALPAHASDGEVLLTCPEPAGKTVVTDGEWYDDGFTDGAISLTFVNGAFDIITKDAYGTRTATSDGATVVIHETANSALVVVAAYPHAVETYIFDSDEMTMVMTVVKIFSGPKRGGLYHASCH